MAGGLDSPVAITHAGDGSGRLFVTEQAGRIRIVDGDGLREAPFLDIVPLVSSGGERGLLSTAFAPDYETSGLFYLFYTNLAGNLVVARYSVSSDPDAANPAGTVLLTIPHPGAANHNGGQLQFGPDGYLYVGTGDGGGGGDPDGNAQDLGVLLGKILRIDVGGGPLAPHDNPFVDGSAATRDEIWAYGLRNPWRFSFDRETGDLFIGDVGQGCWEEVDLQPARSRGGENYGWNVTEGSRCYAPPSCSPPPTCMSPSFTSPVLVYGHADPADCAVTGGFRYRGSAIAGLPGTYVFGDYCSGKIWGASESEGSWTPSLLANTAFLIPAFGEDESGELYVADLGAGAIHRIVAAAAEPYADDFEDGDASDWTVLSGEWAVVSGDLTNAAARRAAVLAPYAGCRACTIEADLRIETASGKASILGWYEDRRNYVELRLSERLDLVTLRRVLHGRVVFSRSVRRPLAPSADVHVAITRDAESFSVVLENEESPAIVVRDRRPAAGTIGFRVEGGGNRRATAALREISVR